MQQQSFAATLTKHCVVNPFFHLLRKQQQQQQQQQLQ